jgi:hypothetical protein
MLLGFCSGASNFQISSTGTLENHAGEISDANAELLVAQASTSLVENDTPVVDLITLAHGVLVIIFALGLYYIDLRKKLAHPYEKWMAVIGILYFCLFISSTGFAVGLHQASKLRNSIGLGICAGVSGLMLICWFVYYVVVIYRRYNISK